MERPAVQYLHPRTTAPRDVPYPVGQRLIQGWSAVPVQAAAEAPATLLADWAEPHGNWDDPRDYRLRLTVASDVREIVRVQLSSARTGADLGVMDFRYSYVMQPHELRLAADQARLIVAEGLTLRRIEGANPFWIICDCPALAPRLAINPAGNSADSPGALFTLCSLESLQPFGWLEGCVLDGLLELSRVQPHDPRFAQALTTHLAQFTDPVGELVYENPRNQPADGTIYGEECPLPLAILAQINPDSPWLDLAMQFFRAHRETLTRPRPDMRHVAETSYTCAYAMAALSQVRPDEGWGDMAIAHLHRQREALTTSDALYLRRAPDGTRTEHLHWGRAYSWYLLGLARSLPLLPPSPDAEALWAEFRRVCDQAAQRQLPGGLWSVYLDAPNLLPDTAASAGIAAAFALGARGGQLPGEYRERALQAHRALNAFLTPDGHLSGVAQSNKGGEDLQRSNYRVIAQFGLGLHGLLTAAL